MATSATANTFILCLTEGEHDTNLLLVRRVLVQKRVDGRAVQGVIPHWAGQWGVITASPTQSQPIIATAYDTFLSQTSLNLADPVAAKPYEILGTETKTLQDSDYNPVPVLYVICAPRGLAALTADVQANIEARKPRDGVLEMAAIKRLPEATTLLEPVLPPTTGWKQYLIANYYGGKAPGPLNLDIGTLTERLTTYSAEPPTAFSVVIKNVPKSGVVPPVTTGRLVELKVNGAEHTPSGIWYQSYAPGQSIFLQAVTEPATPEVQQQIRWQGGTPDPFGYANLRTVPLDRLTPRGAPFIVQASLGDQTKSVKVAVVPNLLRFDVTGAQSEGENTWGLNSQGDSTAVVRAVVEPDTTEAYTFLTWSGGEVDPRNPHDRRLVPTRLVRDPKNPLPVEVHITVE